MIQSLRRRFTAIALLSVILVLGGIIASINISNYHRILDEADQILSIIADNKGIFPKNEEPPKDEPVPYQSASDLPMEPLKPGRGDEGKKRPDRKDMSPEASFTTRYFTVTLDAHGQVSSFDIDKIAAVSADNAAQMAQELFASQDTVGFYDNYRYCAVATDSSTQYIFLDRTNELDTFYSFMWISVGISTGGVLLVLVLVLFFSRLAMKPVAESYEKQKQFITDAGHELKTPLTIIDANTEVLEMMNGENEWTDSIRNQVKRLSTLTGELVTLSRMEEKMPAVKMADFSLSDAISETAEPYKAVAISQNKQLTVTVDNHLSYHGDETALRRLVGLLLDNAMKYSADQSEIRLILKANGKRRILIVENSVEVPPTETPEKWFERFYRSDASRNSATGGHGIGLATARAIVTAHKGKISAKIIDRTIIQITAIL